MVTVVPRSWWKSRAWSLGLARFSKPLVALTDRFVGETHAIRVECTAEDGSKCVAVQSHQSFRRIVGQSCAEFLARLLAARGLMDLPGDVALPCEKAGVFLPEALFEAEAARRAMLERLLAVEGTLDYEFELELK